MLAKTFSAHPDIYHFSWSKDAELDAAQLLAGSIECASLTKQSVRLCLQTTYLNERYREYLDHSGNFHLVWLIRNPYSVVYSMVHNWSRFALNELFMSCGLELAGAKTRANCKRFGALAAHPVDRACYSYLGKLNQCSYLVRNLDDTELMVLQYEDLVQHKDSLTPVLYEFAGLPHYAEPSGNISTRSLGKADNLKPKERQRIDELCSEPYQAFLRNQNMRPAKV